MPNRSTTGYMLFKNRATGRFWGVLRVGPNFIYTQSSYVNPLLALRRLVNRQNTNLMANASLANMRHWFGTAGVNRLANNNVVALIRSDPNLNNKVTAAGTLTFYLQNSQRR